jgi:signal transduction histidine kinase
MRLVNPLLLMARADAGQKLRHESLPVKPLLEDVCRQAKLLAPDSTIACDPPSDLAV